MTRQQQEHTTPASPLIEAENFPLSAIRSAQNDGILSRLEIKDGDLRPNPLWQMANEFRGTLIHTTKTDLPPDTNHQWLKEPEFSKLWLNLAPFHLINGVKTPSVSSTGLSYTSQVSGNRPAKVEIYFFEHAVEGQAPRMYWRVFSRSSNGQSLIALDSQAAGGIERLLSRFQELGKLEGEGRDRFNRDFGSPYLALSASEDILWINSKLVHVIERMGYGFRQQKVSGPRKKLIKSSLSSDAAAWVQAFSRDFMPFTVFEMTPRREAFESISPSFDFSTTSGVDEFKVKLGSGVSGISTQLRKYVLGDSRRDSFYHRQRALLQLEAFDSKAAFETAREMLSRGDATLEVASLFWNRSGVPKDLKRDFAIILHSDPVLGESARRYLRPMGRNPLRSGVRIAGVTLAAGIGISTGGLLDRHLPSYKGDKSTPVKSVDPALEIILVDNYQLYVPSGSTQTRLSIGVYAAVLNDLPSEILLGRPLSIEPEAENFKEFALPWAKSIYDPSIDRLAFQSMLADGNGIIALLYDPLWIPERRSDSRKDENFDLSVSVRTTKKQGESPRSKSSSSYSITIRPSQDPVTEVTTDLSDLPEIIHSLGRTKEGQYLVSMSFKAGDPRLGREIGNRHGNGISALELPLASANIEILRRLPSGKFASLSVTSLQSSDLNQGLIVPVTFTMNEQSYRAFIRALERDEIVFRNTFEVDTIGSNVPRTIVTEVPSTVNASHLELTLGRHGINAIDKSSSLQLPTMQEIEHAREELLRDLTALSEALSKTLRANLVHAVGHGDVFSLQDLFSSSVILASLHAQIESLKNTEIGMTSIMQTDNGRSQHQDISLNNSFVTFDSLDDFGTRVSIHQSTEEDSKVETNRYISRQSILPSSNTYFLQPLEEASSLIDLPLLPSRFGGIIYSVSSPDPSERFPDLSNLLDRINTYAETLEEKGSIPSEIVEELRTTYLRSKNRFYEYTELMLDIRVRGFDPAY